MSTTNVESWAVDLADVGAIYPFVGTEFIMVLAGLAFWIIWHVWQFKFENRTYEEDLKILKDKSKLERAMKEQRMD